MRHLKLIAAGAVAAAALAFAPAAVTPAADAQISFGVNIGAPPVCPYGYYGYAPYQCAPYGYYGSEWFNNGIFIGAGRYYHGPAGFHGNVDHRYDPHYGYRGPYPNRGEQFHPQRDFQDFHGNAQHDSQGHEYHGH